MQAFARYVDLLEWIERRGLAATRLGATPDGAPIVGVRAGGDKEPAVFISAGSHATEHAGVCAAAELLVRLETDHQVHVIPCRDPMGLNGFAYALGLGLGAERSVSDLQGVAAILRAEGDVLFDEGDTLLVRIGEYGYATRGLYNRFPAGAPFLEPLRGRRIFYPAHEPGVEGSACCQRAYTLVVSPEGEILHLNRFHDTPWAPAEPWATRRLMARIRPGLTLDLHEHGGDAFWFSARHQRQDEDERWEHRMAAAMRQSVVDSGAALVPEDYLPGSFFARGERGVYWLHAQQRGEGLNLADFAASAYGPAFTVETGMRASLEHRVHTAVLAAQAAVRVLGERFA